jgi:hypothetical protein
MDNIELEKLATEQKMEKSKEYEYLRKKLNNNDSQPTLKQLFVKKEKYESSHPKQIKFDCRLFD